MPRGIGGLGGSDFVVPDVFKNSEADLRILSIDDVEFRVHRAILTEGSVVFRDMLRTPRPQSASRDEPIPWLEPAWIIERLLQYMYPIPKSSIRKLDQCITLLHAADKWQIDVATWMLRQELVAPRFLEGKALKIYAVACQLGFEKEKDIASKKACEIEPCATAVRDQIEHLSAMDLLWLLHLRSSPNASPKDFFPEPKGKAKERFQKSEPSPEPTPFSVPEMFHPPNGDLVLQSSDDVEFRVYRLFLTQASPVFRKTLEDPSYAPREISGDENGSSPTLLPLLCLAESARDVCDLLYYMYPVPKPKLHRSLDDLVRLIRIAKEWHFELALSALREELVSPTHLESKALRVYGLARRLGLEDEQRKALTKAVGDDPLGHTDREDYRDLTAGEVLHIVDIRNELTAEALKTIAAFRYPDHGNCHHASKGCFDVQNFVRERLNQSVRVRPLPDVVDEVGPTIGFTSRLHYCPTCAVDGTRYWERKKALDQLRATLDKKVRDTIDTMMAKRGAPK